MENSKVLGFIFRGFPLGWVCLFVLGGIFVAGLWPFSPFPKNGVEWLQSENGIRFHGRGFVHGLESRLGALPRRSDGKSFTVELWLRPEIEPQNYLPVFLSIYDQHSLEAIQFAQWRSEFIVRRQNLDTPLEYQEFGLGSQLRAGERRVVTIVFDVSQTLYYVDGKLKGRHPSNPFWSFDHQATRWILGNSPNGRSAWQGDVFALALYNRALTGDEVSRKFGEGSKLEFPVVSAEKCCTALFVFAEKSGELISSRVDPEDHFHIAKFFHPPHKEILTPPWKDFEIKQSYLMDMSVNVLGFMPFGFFFAIWFKKYLAVSSRESIRLTVVVAAALSLSIELMQAWIPLRDSQLMDLLTNTSGAAAGAFCFAVSKKYSQMSARVSACRNTS